MNLDDVLTGLAAALDSTIEGVTVHATVPSKMNPPALVCTIEGVTYGQTFDEEMGAALGVTVVAHRVDAKAGQTALYQFAELTGSKSIVAAIKADPTLGGTVDFCVVRTAQPPGTITVGNIDYIAMQFLLEVGG